MLAAAEIWVPGHRRPGARTTVLWQRGVGHIVRVAAVACVLAAVLAGCLQDMTDPALPRHLHFGEPVVAGVGAVGETFLALGADGVALACSHATFTRPSPLWVSRDDGAAWVQTEPGPNVLPSGDCDVEVSDEGVWAMLYDWVGGATVATSRDDGRTWRLNPLAALPVTGAVDRPWIGFLGERLILTWKSVQYHPTVIAAAYSDDYGATWSPPLPLDIRDDPAFPAAIQSDVKIAGGRAYVFVTLYQTNPLAGPMGLDEGVRFDLLVSDDGFVWSRSHVQDLPAADIINGAAAGADTWTGRGASDDDEGAVHLWWAYAAPDGNAESLFVLHSGDGGTTWDEPQAVVEGGDFDTPAIAARDDGTATLLVMQREPTPWIRAFRLDSAAPGLVLDEMEIASDNGAPQNIEFMDIEHDERGRAAALFGWRMTDTDCTDLRYPVNDSCLVFVRET